MTLRLRLMVIIGLSYTVLWLATSVWMYADVRAEFRRALDSRLAASASMVAGLVADFSGPGAASSEPRSILDVIAKDGVACEIRMLNGGVIARTLDSPEGLGAVSVGYRTRTINGVRWRSYTLEQAGKRVTAADRVENRLALLRKILLSTILPVLVAMAGSLVVLWFGIRKGLAPLESLRQVLARRQPEATDALSLSRLPAELTPLVQTINSLLDRTQRAIERERRFAGDAAHELRTPLTVVKTHIQVARLAQGEDRAIALANAEQGVQRLQRTLEQLLMLVRVEGPFDFEGQDIAYAKDIARFAIDDIPAAGARRICLRAQAPDCLIDMPPVLVITALRNLLDNALRYSPEGTTVLLCVEPDEAMCRFAVHNTGQGLWAKDRPFVVQRFWRAGPGQGSGLGLSIVDAIVRRFGGSFELRQDAEGGTVAEIRLPVAQAQ
ncbi:two-component sensor histidine kinase [Pusillimonas sp. TS35]|uniref:sensor histidine kinase n=1 Tax=Paracandidimonas lactea TaxID=2895524 RepID=UPI00136ECDC2|nr:sensor histidine kinase [Paracandidimonas lactea]MYN14410.1 two-component sensor histidine kinase [Pusillimonas sp. TS35]